MNESKNVIAILSEFQSKYITSNFIIDDLYQFLDFTDRSLFIILTTVKLCKRIRLNSQSYLKSDLSEIIELNTFKQLLTTFK